MPTPKWKRRKTRREAHSTITKPISRRSARPIFTGPKWAQST